MKINGYRLLGSVSLGFIIICYCYRRGFPFISTTCLIDNKTHGSLLLQYFKDLPELRDILYSILIGIPFVIIAYPKDKRYN